jgi:hypothetical protein
MSSQQQTSLFTGVAAFETFMSSVAETIGILPELQFDQGGLTHRLRIFDKPASPPMVQFSRRALIRYKLRKDVIDHALVKDSADTLCSGACLLLGKELLLTNRFVGAAFIAHAFTRLRSLYRRDDDVFEYLLNGVREDDQAATINFFHPLAHEIGHFERSQALCPQEIRSPAFHETYRICFEETRDVIGELDYRSAQQNSESPLKLSVLREEVASDWFAVAAVLNLICMRAREFRVYDIFGSLMMFPLVNAFEEICLKEWRSPEFVRETVLATQCRYSVLIDSMRSRAKHLMPRNHREVDEALDLIDTMHRKALRLIAEAGNKLIALSRELMPFSDQQIADYLARKTHPEQRGYLHSYLIAILDDEKGYPLSGHNRGAYRRLFDRMVTVDTLIIDGNGRVIGVKP